MFSVLQFSQYLQDHAVTSGSTKVLRAIVADCLPAIDADLDNLSDDAHEKALAHSAILVLNAFLQNAAKS